MFKAKKLYSVRSLMVETYLQMRDERWEMATCWAGDASGVNDSESCSDWELVTSTSTGCDSGAHPTLSVRSRSSRLTAINVCIRPVKPETVRSQPSRSETERLVHCQTLKWTSITCRTPRTRNSASHFPNLYGGSTQQTVF